MAILKNKCLALFLNTGTSLEIWNSVGFLTRELSLYNILSKNFKKIFIFTYGSKKDLVYEKYLENNIIIITKKTKINSYVYELFIPFKFRKILKKCDIYKTNQNVGALAPMISKIIFRKKFIVRSGYICSLHKAKLLATPFYHKIYIYLVELFSYLICDKAFIPMKNNYDILIKKYPFLKNKLIIMNNYIDTEKFKYCKIKKKYDIIYVGNLNKNKKHIDLLKAVKGLDISLCFIGQGPYKSIIIRQAQLNKINLKLIDRVPNEELPKYYNAARICVFPSLHEGCPKSLLEAMSCELPTIGFNVIGVRDIIKNGQTGIISKLNTDSLREKIVKLLPDELLQSKLGVNARKYVLENFSLKKLAQREINIYKEIFKNDNIN